MNPLPDPTHFQSIGWITVALFALLGGVNQLLRLTDRFKPRDPHPPLHQQFADKEETDQRMGSLEHRLDLLRADTDRRFDSLEVKIESARLESRQLFDAHNQSANERAELIHHRINKVLEAVSLIQGRCQAFHHVKEN